MARAKRRKLVARNLIESPTGMLSIFERVGRFLARNRGKFLISFSVVALGVGAFFFYQRHAASPDEESQIELFQAVHYFEADEFEKALDGDGNSLGFLDIMEDYPGTKAANLASFYAGSIYLKDKKYEEAIPHLANFLADDFLIQARAYALQGDAYMEMEDFAQAVTLYKKAANWHPNKYFSPIYLIKACVAHRTAGDVSAALSCYQEIVDKYFGAAEYQEAKKEVARLAPLVKREPE